MERPPFRTQERISWGLAASSAALAFGFWASLDAYLDVRSPSAHDMAEPFMAIWGSGTVAAIVLLSLGAVALRGWWRPLLILSPVSIAGLIWLWISNLLGAVGDGSISPDGLLVGALMSAQVVVFLAWLGIILWWRDTWSRAPVVLALVLIAAALLAAWDLGFPWQGPLYPPFGEPSVLALVLSTWGSVTSITIGSLVVASGDDGATRPILRTSALALVAALGFLLLSLATWALLTGRLHDATVISIAEASGLVVALSVWLALIWRWARIGV
jgi:hypothetical protein